MSQARAGIAPPASATATAAQIVERFIAIAPLPATRLKARR